MVVADDLEPELGRIAAERIAVDLSDSAACKMMCDDADDVVPVELFNI